MRFNVQHVWTIAVSSWLLYKRPDEVMEKGNVMDVIGLIDRLIPQYRSVIVMRRLSQKPRF